MQLPIFLVTVLSGLILSLLVGPGVACSDVVYLRDGGAIYGRILRQNDDHLFFNQRIGRDQYRQRTLRRDEFSTITLTVDPRRLATLAPEHPEEYRDYAEELAAARQDPEARELAMRLYLLAAYWGQGELRESALRGMIDVAADLFQRKRCQALAFQLTGRDFFDDPGGLETVSDDTIESQAMNELIRSLRLMRDGQLAEAAAAINQPDVKKCLARFEQIGTWQQLHDWTRDGALASWQLSRIIQMELAAEQWVEQPREFAANAPAAKANETWSAMLNRRVAPQFLVDFSNVCPYDVGHSVFREGRWIAPPKN